MHEKTTELTTRTPLKQIFFFSTLLLFGTLFQQIYSFVDTIIIIGRCLGEYALAAIGVTYGLCVLILGFYGDAQTVSAFPSHRLLVPKGKRRCTAVSGTGLALRYYQHCLYHRHSSFNGPASGSHSDPGWDLHYGGYIHPRYLSGSIPMTVLYNYSASVMRSFGDSRHPFYNLLISTVLNIAGDVLFVTVLLFGVAGAAAATILSQGVNCLLNLLCLCHGTSYFCVQKDEFPICAPHAKLLYVIGLPRRLEYSVSATGFIIMQYAINSLGSPAIAGQSAGEKIRQMFTLPMERKYNTGTQKLECLYKWAVCTIVIDCIHLGNKDIRVFLLILVILVGTSLKIFVVRSLLLCRLALRHFP